MKILAGALLAVLLALALAGWQLRQSWDREAKARAEVVALEGQTQTLEDQNAKLLDRFDSLDSVMTGFNQAQATNQNELLGRLKALTKIVKETGDSDETVTCFDLPVPAQLDRLLREPASDDRIPERVPTGQPSPGLPRG